MFFVVELLCKPVVYVAIPITWIQNAVPEEIAGEKKYSSREITVFVAKNYDAILKDKDLKIPVPNFLLPKKHVFLSEADCCYDAKIYCYRGITNKLLFQCSIGNTYTFQQRFIKERAKHACREAH